jgi:predicted esterase YcpF (UPF0227 family)
MGLVVYFHGLESNAGGPKYKILKDTYGQVYSPQMDYAGNPNLFNQVYDNLKNQKIRIIIGSSMGGYFAYYLGKKLGCDTILFNPALPYRTTFNPTVDTSGKRTSFSNVIIGKRDNIILPEDTLEWLTKNEKSSNYAIDYEENGHQTPVNIFTKYVKKYA